MRKVAIYLNIASLLIISSCASDLDSDAQDLNNNEGIQHNRWIYEQMNQQYLWRKDLPDSLSCDYSLSPTDFFYSLLSPKDRFSYCSPYPFYEPHYGDLSRVAPMESSTVTNDSIYTIGKHRIGYFCYRQFDSVEDFLPVIRAFIASNITQLIVDLRYNPGGAVATCKILANTIVNQRGYGQIFQQCHYNDRLSETYLLTQGDSVSYNYFETPSNFPGGEPNSNLVGLSLDSVYFLVSNRSASASEALIISLRPFMKVTLIGEQTVGKGVGSWTIADRRFQYELHPITMRYYNADMQTTPDSGLVVDHEVKGGLNVLHSEIGQLEEPLLAKAISLIID